MTTMQTPVLFLDIDGVLNSEGWLARYQGRALHLPTHASEMIDPGAVARLDRIQRATGCLVVVSSSWRHRLPLAGIEQHLRHHGLGGRLHDRTPAGTSRTSEIVAWLTANGGTARPHVALEDEPDPGAEHFARVRWLITSFATGLTEADADLAIALLGTSRP